MCTKTFDTHFQHLVERDSGAAALTLPISSVTNDPNLESGIHSLAHASGWTITGEIMNDYYSWINEFTATHPLYGKIKGNFETTVTADSEEALNHFVLTNTRPASGKALVGRFPEAWDYHDI